MIGVKIEAPKGMWGDKSGGQVWGGGCAPSHSPLPRKNFAFFALKSHVCDAL